MPALPVDGAARAGDTTAYLGTVAKHGFLERGSFFEDFSLHAAEVTEGSECSIQFSFETCTAFRSRYWIRADNISHLDRDLIS